MYLYGCRRRRAAASQSFDSFLLATGLVVGMGTGACGLTWAVDDGHLVVWQCGSHCSLPIALALFTSIDPAGRTPPPSFCFHSLKLHETPVMGNGRLPGHGGLLSKSSPDLIGTCFLLFWRPPSPINKTKRTNHCPRKPVAHTLNGSRDSRVIKTKSMTTRFKSCVCIGADPPG